ncbi:MAG: MFS transporter [Actinomycetota bacterium]
MVVNFGYFLSIGVMNPVLPRFIEGPVGSSDIGVGIGIGSFTVTALLLRPWSGRFGDRIGRRAPIIVGALVHTAACAGFLLATTLTHVILLRLVTGISEALLFVSVATAIQDLAPDDRRGEAASFFSLSLFLALAIGPVIGEELLRQSGFDAVWLFGAGAAGLGLLISFSIPDTRTHTDVPDKPPPLIHGAAIRPGLILGSAIWGLAAFNAFVPLYALELGLDGARLVFLVNAVVIMLFRSVGARIPDRFGAIPVARFSLFCTPVGLGVMGLWSDIPGLFVGAVILACGQALAFPALMTVAVNNALPTERGAVMGTFTAFFDLSFGGGAIALGFVAHAWNYNGAFLVAMGVAAMGFATMVFAPPRIKTPIRPTEPIGEVAPPGN